MNQMNTERSGNHESTKKNSKWLLTWLILGGLLIGAIVGEVLFQSYSRAELQPTLDTFNFFGNTVFMGLLKMILLPLIASSVIVGVGAIGDPSKLGRIGGFAVLYYFSTMLIAVILGLMLVTTIKPGDPNRDNSGIGKAVIEKGESEYGAGKEAGSTQTQRIEQAGEGGGLWGAFKKTISQMIPSNPFRAAAESQLLSVISFAIIFGVALILLGSPGRPVFAFFDGVFQAVMKIVDWILCLAPVGVFFLVAWTVARQGLESLAGPMLWYVITVIVGLLLHALVILPLILYLFTRTNPFLYLHQMRTALLTAFTTDSSSATLPVTIECAEEMGNVKPRSARFVLPLGATVNMDGTALYEAVAVVFLFQAYGIPLGLTELIIIAVTATLAAIGAAGIPSAGLVTMVIVIQAVNSSLGGDKQLALAAAGLILGIDRILDMCRTTVNVWGDAVGAKLISNIIPDGDEESATPAVDSG